VPKRSQHGEIFGKIEKFLKNWGFSATKKGNADVRHSFRMLQNNALFAK